MYKNIVHCNFRKTVFHCLISFLIITIAPSKGFNQTTAVGTSTLLPAAQEAIDKGIQAAKVQDYLQAIRYFEDARTIAPDAPIVFFNLGLAESKIPGRELRAIAWFEAYITACPNAPNVAAVKEQIAMLNVKNQDNISHFLKTVQDVANKIADQDAANKMSGLNKEGAMVSKSLAKVYLMPQLWLKAG